MQTVELLTTPRDAENWGSGHRDGPWAAWPRSIRTLPLADPMMKIVMLIVAAALIVIGAVWAMQGLGVMGGSAMSGRQADVHHDQIDAGESADGLGDGVVGVVPRTRGAKFFEAEPGDGAAGVDGELAERFAEVDCPGAGRPADAAISCVGPPIPGCAAPAGWERDGAAGFRPRRGRFCRPGSWPAGSASRRAAWSPPVISSVSSTRSSSAGSHRCARAVATRSSAAARRLGRRTRRVNATTWSSARVKGPLTADPTDTGGFLAAVVTGYRRWSDEPGRAGGARLQAARLARPGWLAPPGPLLLVGQDHGQVGLAEPPGDRGSAEVLVDRGSAVQLGAHCTLTEPIHTEQRCSRMTADDSNTQAPTRYPQVTIVPRLSGHQRATRAVVPRANPQVLGSIGAQLIAGPPPHGCRTAPGLVRDSSANCRPVWRGSAARTSCVRPFCGDLP